MHLTVQGRCVRVWQRRIEARQRAQYDAAEEDLDVEKVGDGTGFEAVGRDVLVVLIDAGHG